MKKYLVNQIVKMAQELNWLPGTAPTETKAQPTQESSGPFGSAMEFAKKQIQQPGVGLGNQSVKKMQQALINLSNSALDKMGLQSHSVFEPTTPQEQQQALSRHAFGDFIVQNYMQDSPATQADFLNPASKETKAPSKMHSILSTMARIGGDKALQTVDGKWGPKTNTGLLNAVGLAQAFLKLASDFKVKLTSYDQKNLEELKSLVPNKDSDVSVLDKIERAPAITSHLQKISSMLEEIENNIFKNPSFQPYIDGDKAFATYKKQDKLNKNQEEILNNLKTHKDKSQYAAEFYVSLNNKTYPIKFSDLLDAESFKNWLTRSGLDKQPINQVLSEVKNSLSEMRGTLGQLRGQ